MYCIDILKSCSVPASDEPRIEMMRSLFKGYNPTFKLHPLGWEAESLLLLSPTQQMCYYNGKLFGGYIALLMDRILADSCKSAVTAYLNTSYLHSVPPTAPILLRAWPPCPLGRASRSLVSGWAIEFGSVGCTFPPLIAVSLDGGFGVISIRWRGLPNVGVSSALSGVQHTICLEADSEATAAGEL